MSLPYYKIFPSEELGNYQIMTLSHEALGVWYLLRVCHLWQHQGRIPDDPDYISPLLRLASDKWLKYRQDFLDRGLIQVIDNCLTISSLREKWLNAKQYSEDQSAKRREAIRVKKMKKNNIKTIC
jgi:hypothetical protein